MCTPSLPYFTFLSARGLRVCGFTLVSSTGVDYFFTAAAFFLGVVDFS
jgi:hypothetical protein